MYRLFEKIFIICNFSIAFSNQKCYNTIIQFLFAWDLSYPGLFQSIARFCRFVSFLFCLRRGVLCLSIVASTFLLSIEFNSDSLKRITMCPPMRANTEKTSTGGLLPPVDFLYTRHEISCHHVPIYPQHRAA